MDNNKLVFELNKIPDSSNSAMNRLADYQEIKKMYFQSAKAFSSGESSKRKFFLNVIKPRIPATVKLNYGNYQRWTRKMEPHLARLQGMYIASEAGMEAKTLLQKEHEKLVFQVEIRQDVTEVMHSFVKNLKNYLSDEELFKNLSQKEILELYKVIREEEDRAKNLTLKERAEDRADNQFAWFISQARAGVLETGDIEFLSDDIKEDLSVFRTDDGSFALPTGAIPKIKTGIKKIRQYAYGQTTGTIPKTQPSAETIPA